MAALTPEELQEIVRAPRESFDTELKSWIDPKSPEGIAKIAKACIALRNNNGGKLLIGFNDTGEPCGTAPFPDVAVQFHVDDIQAIATKYASRPFEVFVDFAERDGVGYPVIRVPSGVDSPVASKRALSDAATGKALIQSDIVYVRTTEANMTVSTAGAKHGDYERLTKICFENREADVASFLRRNFSDMLQRTSNPLLAELLQISPAPLTSSEAATAFLDYGRIRFEKECTRREMQLPQIGFREIAAVIDGDVPIRTADEQFLRDLQWNKPHHSGWTPWVNTLDARQPAERAYTFDGGWEAFVGELRPALFGSHVDFWRIEPRGRFYYLAGLQEDLPRMGARTPEPRTIIDFLLQINRVAEAVSTLVSFAKSMGCNEQTTRVAIAVRWSGIDNRELTSWVEPQRSFYSRGVSRQDVIATHAIVPLETSQGGLIPFVEQLIAPLFACFGGMKFDSPVIAGIAQETLERRM